jgi:hypothetical protein
MSEAGLSRASFGVGNVRSAYADGSLDRGWVRACDESAKSRSCSLSLTSQSASSSKIRADVIFRRIMLCSLSLANDAAAGGPQLEDTAGDALLDRIHMSSPTSNHRVVQALIPLPGRYRFVWNRIARYPVHELEHHVAQSGGEDDAIATIGSRGQCDDINLLKLGPNGSAEERSGRRVTHPDCGVEYIIKKRRLLCNRRAGHRSQTRS